MKECLTNRIFGLLAFHYSYIRKIKPGLPLFLFNYSDRKIHGIYEAASNGEMNINPYGWSEDGQEPTKCPAQVRICIRKQCKSLLEEQYKPILIDNYYTEDHFWFELDHTQTRHLILLFESLVIVIPKRAFKHDMKLERASGAKKPQYSSNWNYSTPFEEENEEEVVYRKLLQIVNEKEKKAKSHLICRRNISMWFSTIPLLY
ncbi:hypothetical protein MKX01_002293 [Papaver californicum]|nr:hypothetical protein MKX01_002293 [Papaver californicum]